MDRERMIDVVADVHCEGPAGNIGRHLAVKIVEVIWPMVSQSQHPDPNAAWPMGQKQAGMQGMQATGQTAEPPPPPAPPFGGVPVPMPGKRPDAAPAPIAMQYDPPAEDQVKGKQAAAPAPKK